MVRRVRVDGHPVSRSAAAFGVSCPTLYQAQAALARGGLAALVPRNPGPRRSHKLSAEVVDFLHWARTEEPALRSPELAPRVRVQFGRTVHPRSIERALARRKKTTVIAAHAATSDDTFVATYEGLRRRVLAGAPFGGSVGLVLLLREGIAAWMTRGSVGAAPVEAADAERRGAAPLVSNEIPTAVVRVLVSMALGGLKEKRA